MCKLPAGMCAIIKTPNVIGGTPTKPTSTNARLRNCEAFFRLGVPKPMTFVGFSTQHLI